jgi:hypothetical protein
MASTFANLELGTRLQAKVFVASGRIFAVMVASQHAITKVNATLVGDLNGLMLPIARSMFVAASSAFVARLRISATVW